MEHVHKIDEIDHPAVREVLRFLKIREGVEIHHDGDLPARTGLGSSSAFTVGLLHALYALKGIMPTKERLAKEAIYVEQQMCQENVGCQDQTLAAYGGFNFIEFGGDNHMQVRSITVPADTLKKLQNHLMLYFTGFSRNASEIAKHQIDNIPNKQLELTTMYDMAFQALDILNKGNLEKFGKLMYESWKIKRELSAKISTSHIDALYDSAMRAGATGGSSWAPAAEGSCCSSSRPRNKENLRKNSRNYCWSLSVLRIWEVRSSFINPTGNSHVEQD